MKLSKISFLLCLVINIILCEGDVKKEDSILKESKNIEKQPKNLDNITKKNQIGLYPSKELTNVVTISKEQIEKENNPSFDIERFLKEFDNFDCNIGYDEETGEEIHNQECLDKMSFKIFEAFGQDNNKSKMFNALNENVYRPLGYTKEKKNTIAELFIDAMDTEKENKKILNLDFPTNYGGFENMILDSFKKMEKDSGDMENNNKDVKDTIKKILTSFHLYWNTLRSKNMTDKIRIDTKAIIRNILSIYQKNESKSMDLVKIISNKIKEMYSNFIDAYQFITVIQTNGFEIIGHQFTRRYKRAINLINNSEMDGKNLIYELAILLDIAKAYNIMLYHNKRTETFEMGTGNRIKKLFQILIIENKLNEKKKGVFKEIKHFTIILLLKLKHIDFIMKYLHKMEDVVSRPNILLSYEKNTSIKVKKEFFDMLKTIPDACSKTFDRGTPKKCIYNQINNALAYIYKKYNLKRSIGGIHILNFIMDLGKGIIDDGEEENFKDYRTFKTYFFQKIFSQNKYYQREFEIKELQSIDELENILGNTISYWKSDIIKDQKSNFGLLDQLEVSLYEFFLDINGNFNNYFPIDNKPSILYRVESNVNEFLDNFFMEHNAKISENFSKLITKLKQSTNYWRTNIYKRRKLVSFQLSVPLMAQNLSHTSKVYENENSIYKINPNSVINITNQSLENIRVHNEMVKEVHNLQNVSNLDKKTVNEENNGFKFKLINSKEYIENYEKKMKENLENDLKEINKEKKENDTNVKIELENSLNQNSGINNDASGIFENNDVGMIGGIISDDSGSFYTGGGD